MIKGRSMTMDELDNLERVMKNIKHLADKEVLPMLGRHFQNEECRALHRVHGALVEAEVGIRHFLLETNTATKWRNK